MTRHLTTDDLDRFRSGDMSGEDVLALSAHLEECAACAALARGRVGDESAEAIIRSELGLDDVAAAPPRWKRIAAIAAALAAVAIAAAILIARPGRKPAAIEHVATSVTLPPEARGYGRADWDALVAAARQAGRVEVPDDIRELRRARDVLRGASERSKAQLSPTGEAVETQQPRFTWSGVPPGPYVVRVFAGREEVAHGSAISATAWSPGRPLRRGVTYAWQLETVDRGRIIPEPPEPPALFHVMDDKTAAEIAEARRRFPDDHLLAGLLCARAGAQSCAVDELARDPDAASLAASVRAW